MATKKKTSKKKTEVPIPVVKGFSIRDALPDDPIYTRGFVLGGRYPRRSHRES